MKPTTNEPPVDPPPASPENCPLDCMRSDDTPHPLCPKHGTPASPEPMPERRAWVDGFGYLDVYHLRRELAKAGWHIVDEASAKVLAACAVAELTDFGYGPQLTVHSAERIAKALKEKRNA